MIELEISYPRAQNEPLFPPAGNRSYQKSSEPRDLSLGRGEQRINGMLVKHKKVPRGTPPYGALFEDKQDRADCSGNNEIGFGEQ